MSSLNYVDMSNNTFDATDVPPWFSTLQSLTTLVIESGSLHGELPKELFSIPRLEQVILDNNKINGTFDMGNNISQQLQTVNLQNNNIAQFTVNNDDATIIRVGNPVCNGPLGNSIYCLLQQPPPPTPYSTSLAKCGSMLCPSDQSIDLQNCLCAHPYKGQFTFRAPFFRDVTTNTTYQELEKSLWTGLSLTPNSVYLSNPFYNTDNYLMVHLKLFPSDGVYFNRSEIQRIANALSSQKYKPPKKFGPYIFTPFPYIFLGEGKSSVSKGIVAGIAVGCSCLIIGLIAVGFYAYRQKKRTEKAMQLSKPFGFSVTGFWFGSILGRDNHNFSKTFYDRSAFSILSRRFSSHTGAEDELHEGFSDLDLAPSDNKDDELESKLDTSPEKEVEGETSADGVADLSEKAKGKKSSASPLFEIMLNTPRESMESVLDKWVEDGNPIGRVEFLVAMLKLRNLRLYGKALQLLH